MADDGGVVWAVAAGVAARVGSVGIARAAGTVAWAGRASLVSYLAPGVALFYGALLLDEAITAAAIAGLVLILGGVAIASRKRVSPSGTGAPLAASRRRPRRGRPLRRAA